MTPKWIRRWASANMTMVAVAAVVMAATVATSALQTQTTRREPQFENEHVRAWKSIIMPNQPLALHRHEFGRTIVALKGGTLDVVNEKGETLKQMTWETGKAYWLDADPPGELHGDMNRGTEPIEVIVVERQP
jgi:beta-alanine degradation protein BauB